MQSIKGFLVKAGIARRSLAFLSVSVLAMSASGCGELTGPESPTTPTDVVATLASATSVTVTWTPSPLNDGVVSYSIFRNGTKVGETDGPVATYTDTGLTPQVTYVYSVAANCKSGIVSARSVETPASTVTTTDVTRPTVISTIPAAGSTHSTRGSTTTVTFSEPMDPASITPATFHIRITATGEILPGTVTYNATTRTAEFRPTNLLPNATSLTTVVTTGVKDLAGNTLAANFTSTWSTRDEVGPTVTATSPTNGATGVPANSEVTITFNEAVDPATVNSTNIVLRVTSSGAVVPAAITYNATTRTVTLKPGAALAQSTGYTVTVSGIRDPAGNQMTAPFQFSFTTADVTAPTVVSVSPANDSTNVATNATVQVTFSEPMDPTTITSANIGLKNTVTGAVVPAIVAYDATNNRATLTPTGPLSNGTNYTLTVTTGVRDAGNNPLASPFTSRFTTVPVADTTAPTVVSRTPAPGDTLVATTVSPTVTFSEPMLASTITNTTITLAPTSGGAAVAATVTYDATTNTATLNPTADLANNVSYTLTVTTAVTDVAGNPLAANSTSSFRTIRDTTPPTVLSTSPATGSPPVPVNSTVTITFSEPMDPATINGSTVSVRTTTGGTSVAGVVSYNVSTRSAIFTPSAALAANTSYTVTVTTGARDISNNQLAGNFTFSFTTAP